MRRPSSTLELKDTYGSIVSDGCFGGVEDEPYLDGYSCIVIDRTLLATFLFFIFLLLLKLDPSSILSEINTPGPHPISFA
jgi:hypothetical protein